MLSPPKLIPIILAFVVCTCMTLPDVSAQDNSQYQRRLQAMQNASSRAAMGVRTASNDIEYDFAAPPEPAARPAHRNQVSQAAPRMRLAQAQPPVTQNRMRTGRPVSQPRNSGYTPEHLRVAQTLAETPIMQDTGAPIMNQTMETPMAVTPMAVTSQAGCASCQGGPIMGGCDSCGSGDYFDDYGFCGGGCDTGGCPPGQDCWLNNFGRLFYNAEYSFGAVGFRQPAFQVPGSNTTVQDSNFGFYGSYNVGVPLCKLTCGLLSGQMGIRAVETNFSGHPFSTDGRDQLFVTAGVYRRVDYGLQFGIVADILHEEWFVESDLVQLRGDLAWVYGNGHLFGFRFTNGLQDDQTIGIFEGRPFAGLNIEALDNYRFYYQWGCPGGGQTEAFLGWATDSHFAMGMDLDLPMGECTALQAGWTYYASEDVPQTPSFAGNANDAWNIHVGVSWRPRGRCWYQYYDRPLLPVADNGTMLMRRF